MARNCNIISGEIFDLGYCNIIFSWYNYNAIEKEAGCFSAEKGIDTMYKIMIKNRWSVTYELSTGWDSFSECFKLKEHLVNSNGVFVDENGEEWCCWIEKYDVDEEE